MGLKWSKYILRIKVTMLIVDKNSDFYLIFAEKEGKNTIREPIVGQKIVI